MNSHDLFGFASKVLNSSAQGQRLIPNLSKNHAVLPLLSESRPPLTTPQVKTTRNQCAENEFLSQLLLSGSLTVR